MLITAIISTGKRRGCVYGYENQLVFLFLCSEVPTIVVCLYLSLLILTQDFRLSEKLIHEEGTQVLCHDVFK